ncbi:hypothetical protein [Fusobacterium sp.]|uniref:hypothetical protein n=1 Tax=Fusobacterium sp. TaxID=68766 RepID=UPI00396CFB93
MKKLLMIILLLTTYVTSFSELTLKIHEPIRFKNVNIRSAGDVVVGEGSIEIVSDNLEADRNKKFIFKFPKKGLMTNNKRWVQIDKYVMEESDRSFRVTRERKLVKIYAFINKNRLNDHVADAEDLQGEYIGYIPVIVEQYGAPVGKIENEGE